MTVSDRDDKSAQEQESLSRSAIKREMLALQEVGERLVALGPRVWDQLALSPGIRDGLEESRRIKSHNAMRRHVRRLGKLLRAEDPEWVKQLIDRIDDRHEPDKARIYRVERWHERLLERGDAALVELLEICPDADRQRLRQLIRAALKKREEDKLFSAGGKLFKYLRDLKL
ncbi:MAG: DUF615 domain-containing protein [Gammaproteobacteria bacterium]|nr:DUF615 domain-containing protein [Gammaproteobacteria bacterium]